MDPSLERPSGGRPRLQARSCPRLASTCNPPPSSAERPTTSRAYTATLCFIFFHLLIVTLLCHCHCQFFSTRPPQRNALVPLSARLTLDRLPLIKPVQATCGV